MENFQKYPQCMFHATLPMQVVPDEKAQKALGPEWTPDFHEAQRRAEALRRDQAQPKSDDSGKPISPSERKKIQAAFDDLRALLADAEKRAQDADARAAAAVKRAEEAETTLRVLNSDANLPAQQ